MYLALCGIIFSDYQHRFSGFKHLAIFSAAWFLFLATSRWFMLRLDIMCALFTGFIAFLSILTASYSKTDAGQVGLASDLLHILTGNVSMGY